ncbi:MAG: metal-dependent hydrolase [Planctomycetaceae bacterium]|nr:metal-dependent hydrolase [Planctomycetaceae bacterium]
MAGFRMHITVSSTIGVIYGGAAVQPMGFETDAGILAAGITAIGGMLPDLDSDSGVPVREMFGLAAAVLPVLLLPRFVHAGMTREAILASMLFGYIFVRYFVSKLFKKLSVHRGMYHSIPAMFIAGLVVYLAYHSPDRNLRILMAVGVMIGFASHLILDEIYSVDFRGVKIVLKSSAGSAVKLTSPSLIATASCYAILGGLGYVAYKEYMKPPEPDPPPQTHRNRRMM